MLVNGAKSGCNVPFSFVFINTFLLIYGSIVGSKIVELCASMCELAKDSWHSSKIIRADEKNAGII